MVHPSRWFHTSNVRINHAKSDFLLVVEWKQHESLVVPGRHETGRFDLCGVSSSDFLCASVHFHGSVLATGNLGGFPGAVFWGNFARRKGTIGTWQFPQLHGVKG